MDIIQTGVPGLDEVFKGGIRRNACILVTGSPGTGKTMLALQFLVEGAKKGEAGLFITVEEDPGQIREFANSVGIELEKYEKKGLIRIIRQAVGETRILVVAAPIQLIRKGQIKRVVLDSLTFFEYAHPSGLMGFRKDVLGFIDMIKKAGVTLITTSEKSVLDLDKITYDPEDFLFDGIILTIRIRRLSTFERYLSVVKMRGQDHLTDIFPTTIGKGGLKVIHEHNPLQKGHRKKSRSVSQ